MKTEHVNNIANEAINHTHYYKNRCLTHKKFNIILLILISTIIIFLIVVQV